jgi:hypothetical protein
VRGHPGGGVSGDSGQLPAERRERGVHQAGGAARIARARPPLDARRRRGAHGDHRSAGSGASCRIPASPAHGRREDPGTAGSEVVLGGRRGRPGDLPPRDDSGAPPASSARAGVAVVAALAAFSAASGVGSVAFKDVLAKTIPKGRRGRLLGFRATVGGSSRSRRRVCCGFTWRRTIPSRPMSLSWP